MRQLGQPADLKADREATSASVNEEAQQRSSSFFQHDVQGDERGQDRLLTDLPLSVEPGTRCRHCAIAWLTPRVDTLICSCCRQHQHLGGPRYEFTIPPTSTADLQLDL